MYFLFDLLKPRSLPVPANDFQGQLQAIVHFFEL